ncbi:unnamed protein product [Schistosoma margrebowiei]|uniref:Uncharacterized protein n=1 Tax=Schistosoma margrebowiei TaxID=48269 RepID=A0A3P8FHK3_9TREM|nr:unnamed protein product [Schistosoma margrebowiei]
MSEECFSRICLYDIFISVSTHCTRDFFSSGDKLLLISESRVVNSSTVISPFSTALSKRLFMAEKWQFKVDISGEN